MFGFIKKHPVIVSLLILTVAIISMAISIGRFFQEEVEYPFGI